MLQLHKMALDNVIGIIRIKKDLPFFGRPFKTRTFLGLFCNNIILNSVVVRF